MRSARVAGPAFGFAAALALILWQLHISSQAGALFGDFRAFYCAAGAAAHGLNPYAASSIYACERAPMPLGLYHATPGVAVPAPLPGYALLLFVPLALLAYPAACALWFVILLGTVVAAARALALLIGRGFGAALCALTVGFAVIVIPFGELGSLVVAAVVWMAVALRRGAWTWAALAGGLAMILPHVALPALIGVFLFVPHMRTRLVVLAGGLAALDLLCGGPAVAISYLRDVLPAHARSEIGSTAQYGMTWVLHGLNVSDRGAIAGGEISYAFMTVLGLIAARSLATQRRDAAYAALAPPAFAVLGGTFMHYTQIMIAIPAVLMLLQESTGRARAIFATSALLLAFPWAWALGQPMLVIVYAIWSAAIALAVLRWNPSAALRAAFGSVLLTGIILFAGYHYGSGLSTHAHAITMRGGLAQSSWEQFVRSQRASTGPAWWVAKAPTWLGLVLLTLGCAYVLTKKNFVAPVAVEEMPVAT